MKCRFLKIQEETLNPKKNIFIYLYLYYIFICISIIFISQIVHTSYYFYMPHYLELWRDSKDIPIKFLLLISSFVFWVCLCLQVGWFCLSLYLSFSFSLSLPLSISLSPPLLYPLVPYVFPLFFSFPLSSSFSLSLSITRNWLTYYASFLRIMLVCRLPCAALNDKKKTSIQLFPSLSTLLVFSLVISFLLVLCFLTYLFSKFYPSVVLQLLRTERKRIEPHVLLLYIVKKSESEVFYSVMNYLICYKMYFKQELLFLLFTFTILNKDVFKCVFEIIGGLFMIFYITSTKPCYKYTGPSRLVQLGEETDKRPPPLSPIKKTRKTYKQGKMLVKNKRVGQSLPGSGHRSFTQMSDLWPPAPFPGNPCTAYM